MCFDLRKPEADRLARAIRDSDEMKRRGLLVGPPLPPRDGPEASDPAKVIWECGHCGRAHCEYGHMCHGCGRACTGPHWRAIKPALNWDDTARMKRENEALIALRHAPPVTSPGDGPRCPQCGSQDSLHWGWALRPEMGEIRRCGRCLTTRVDPLPPRDGAKDVPGRPPREAEFVVAIYATANDGFAGSIGAKLAEEREARERDDDAPFTREEVDALTRRAKDAYARHQQAQRRLAEAQREAWHARWLGAIALCVVVSILAWVAWSGTPTPGGPLAPSPRPALPASGPPQSQPQPQHEDNR